MKINGSVPIHVARAYGVRPAAKPAPALNAQLQPAQAAQFLQPTTTVAPIDVVALSTAQAPQNIQKLIAATVDKQVEFAGATPPPRAAGNFAMYTRAADKIEASVGVAVGRSIDIRG